MNTRINKGQSLIELLLTLSTIAILIALLLSAVQKVRSSATKAACANQLRQMSLALQHHAAQHGAFPPGVSGDDKKQPYPFLAFHARLLPYLEQNALWLETQSAFEKDKNFLHNPPHVGLTKAVPAFGCPMDARTQTSQRIKGDVDRGLTSYLGCEGTNSFRMDGVLYLDSHTKPSDIRDGLSQTLILGERPPSADMVFGWWYGGWGQDKDGEGDSVLGVRTKNNKRWIQGCDTGPYHFQKGDVKNPCSAFHFWSLHPGGAHFAFSDGSVRFLSYSADEILPALATRAAGDSVTGWE
jgi:prepilin-type processing-associated H-X9-DG protein